MANKKISELTEASDLTGAYIEVIQGGENKKASSSLFSGDVTSLVSPDGDTQITVVDGLATITTHSGLNYMTESFTPTINIKNSNDGTNTTEVGVESLDFYANSTDGTNSTQIIVSPVQLNLSSTGFATITKNGDEIATIPTSYSFTVSGTTVTLSSTPSGFVWGYFLNGIKCKVGSGGVITSVVGTLVTFNDDYTGSDFEAIY